METLIYRESSLPAAMLATMIVMDSPSETVSPQ